MKNARLLLLKSASAIPTGARWITVHPSGDGKGQPVLIQPQADGSAKVIGGAGGALNHLRLRSVKSVSQYKEEASARAKEQREAKKKQTAADKAAGIHEAKEEARKQLKEQKRQAERDVIQAVAKKAGWDEKDLQFPEEDYEHLSEAARSKLKSQFHAKLLQRAKDVIQQSRERLINDPAARADAGIGEVPLFSEKPDDLSVQDLAPVPKQAGGLGFNPDYKGRAEAAGLSEEALQHEAHQVKQGKLAEMTDEQKAAAFARGQAASLLKEELSGIQEPAAPTADASLMSAKDALDLIKEGKRLAEIERQAREASAKIDESPVEPQAFAIETSDDAELDAKAREDVINDLRTSQTVAFLAEVGSIAGANPGETLGGHIGVGAYNSINSLALAVSGDALVDRSVVDVLGIAAAAQVLAHRIHSDMPDDEVRHVADGMQDWHVNHYMQTSTESLKKARALTDAAKAIELSDEAKTGADLAVAQELNARRRAAIGDAQRILGQALGEMEANAALVMALKQGKRDSMQVPLGRKTPESAIKQVRAIGLLPGDYSIDKTDAGLFLTINGGGLDRLSKPVTREDVQQVRRNLSIIRGEHDEDGWLPLGVANRPDLVTQVQPGVAPQIAKPFEACQDLAQSLRNYIGGRAADGDAPNDILADVQSEAFFNQVGKDREGEYRKALDEIAPLSHSEEQRAYVFDKYADDVAGNIAPVNRQKFSLDQKSVDALHRALSDTPEGVCAYKQIGELTHQDQRALREFFGKHGADGDMTWGKYVAAMGGVEKAYESVQDMVRSKVSAKFVEAHNKLHPDSPLKLGKAPLRNAEDHLGALGSAAAGAEPDAIGDGERHTLGHMAERQLAGMMGVVGQNFKPSQPTKLWNVSMSGKYVNQQRAIKMLAANKRVGLAFGAGSGKTNIMLGSFAHLHGMGQVKRAVMLVPSIVQGQFGGEALRLLEPGKFKWHIEPGASRDSRIAAYKDPSTHFCVMTHQSFRDDMVHLGAKHAGINEQHMVDQLNAMSGDQRKAWAKGVMEKEGINFDATFVDEAHDTLNRAGKENSSLANVLDSVSDNTPYYLYASGDPVKNDASEAHSMLQKLDPARYADRAAFMRRYGADTIASKDALKREMARYVFPASITPDVNRQRIEAKVDLTDGQKAAIADLSKNLAKARMAQRGGKVDIEAAKAISPGSFDGVPESEHHAVAQSIQKSLGIIKSSAITRIIDQHPDNAKVKDAIQKVKERGDKQGVIFARNRASVEQYKKALEAIGKRVVTITGSDSAKDKDAKRKLFNPEKGAPEADVLIASDAGAVGMNLQSGQYLIQHDVPATAKTHSQRNARIDRIGQENDIELIDMVANHPEEAKARERLAKKYALKDMMADPMDGLDDTGVAGAISARRKAAQLAATAYD